MALLILADIIAVAAAIDAAGTGGALSTEDVAVVLELVEEQAHAIEEAAEAPAHFGTSQPMRFSGIAYRNVAAAFTDAKHLATEDARLGKWVPVLRELLRLLTEMRENPGDDSTVTELSEPVSTLKRGYLITWQPMQRWSWRSTMSAA